MTKAMRVLGMMSGTSADGIDVALVRISGAPPDISAEFEAHHHVAVPAGCPRNRPAARQRRAHHHGRNQRIEFLLGEELARAALAACKKWRVPMREISLIGSHGQTVFHLGASARIQGKVRSPSTLQIGETNVIAERTGVTTVGDFRPADMAAGGQGAPLVPFVDYLLYRDAKAGTRGAQYRRHRQRHRDSRRREARGRLRLRHRPGQHGDRRSGRADHPGRAPNTIATRASLLAAAPFPSCCFA